VPESVIDLRQASAIVISHHPAYLQVSPECGVKGPSADHDTYDRSRGKQTFTARHTENLFTK
jgi:hypothetical protein